MQTDFLCISVLRVASGPRVKLASVIFSALSIAIILLGDERANLSAFHTFDLCFLVLFVCSSSWCRDRLRLVIVALPEFFSYPFFFRKKNEAKV